MMSLFAVLFTLVSFFYCRFVTAVILDQIVSTTVTNKVEPPKMGAVVGSMNVAQTHVASSLPSMEMEEDFTIDNTTHAENIDVTNVILDVEKSRLAAGQTFGWVVVSLFVIIVIVIVRRRNNRRDKAIEVESAKDVNGSTKLAAPQDNHSRPSNLYERDPVHSERKPIEPPLNDGGYMQPTSLKDGYLTAPEAKTGASGESFLLASAVVPGPCDVAFESSESQKKLGALPGYISMNGSGQRLNCAAQEYCNVGDVTSGCANDYTMPVTEPIYAEIPEVSGEIVKT